MSLYFSMCYNYKNIVRYKNKLNVLQLHLQLQKIKINSYNKKTHRHDSKIKLRIFFYAIHSKRFIQNDIYAIIFLL